MKSTMRNLIRGHLGACFSIADSFINLLAAFCLFFFPFDIFYLNKWNNRLGIC
jgi:hypothetical protein